MATDDFNIEFKQATDFILYTNRSIFLTGKAGTGKTTFLKHIKKIAPKQMAIVAPTGVAAINAGGVTIHSFFQLPFSPFLPENKGFGQSSSQGLDKHHLLGRLKINSERRDIFQQLELLIIDEISMVRCDVLDAIDTVLKHVRNRYTEPFGGVQVLLIGDMFQLPPVTQEDEWNILQHCYATPYFFSSWVMQACKPVYIELQKIYRQQDATFIHLLNKVRNNQIDQACHEIFKAKHQPYFQSSQTEGYITLTTHNYKADSINQEQLNRLDGALFSFKATIEQEFSEKSFPADEVLQLKEGAQVMFIKNDSEKIRRYYNGKIGVVAAIETDKILVQCKDEEALIEVKKYRWENVRYALNKQNQTVEEEVVGAFTQYPLRLAWAITIHKSQGLTFEKAIIDAGHAFAPGQVYVALSRCTSLEGLVLHSPINTSSLFTDERIVAYCAAQSGQEIDHEFIHEKKQYQQKVLIHTFQLKKPLQAFEQVVTLIEQNKQLFSDDATGFVQSMRQQMDALDIVAKKFEPHLWQFFQQDDSPEENPSLQEKVQKAAVYFSQHLQQMAQLLKSCTIATDSKQLAKELNELLKKLFVFIAQQQTAVDSCIGGFNMLRFLAAKQSFVAPYYQVNTYATANASKALETENVVLFKQLKKWRDDLCNRQNLPVYVVANTASLLEISNFLPLSSEALLQISGFGKTKVDKHGAAILDIVQAYCTTNQLSTRMHEKTTGKVKAAKIEKPVKINTKAESYKLYTSGKSIEQIAQERNLHPSTIEGHLAYYVSTGDLSVETFITKDKITLIEQAIDHQSKENNSLAELKNKLGENFSFSDIKFVLAHVYRQPIKKDQSNQPAEQ